MEDKKFGEFDLGRKLTDYEMEHFEDFMRPVNTSVSAAEVSLDEVVNEIIENSEQYINGNFQR